MTTRGQERLREIMLTTKRELESSLPFAMDPVVYDFAINEHGTVALLLTGEEALLPVEFYQHAVPEWLRRSARELSSRERGDLHQFTRASRARPEFTAAMPTLLDQLLPSTESNDRGQQRLTELLAANGFDRAQHEEIRANLRSG